MPPAVDHPAAGDSMSPAADHKAAGDGMSPSACGAKLAELFPALFAPVSADAPQPVKPLKLRIQVDIQERAPGVFSKRILGIYFSRYTTSNAYLKALTQAPSRFDLDGNPAGEIDIEHKTAAVQELARRREIAMAKRAEQARAQRAAQPLEQPTPAPHGEPLERPARPPRRDSRFEREQREQRDQRGPKRSFDRPPRPGPRPDRPARPERADHPPRREGPVSRETEVALPQDPAQRERAMLLRAFESSPLSKANFCALKRLSEAELDLQLAQARAEREAKK
jgi:ProP effector